jgi:hypothetical protein
MDLAIADTETGTLTLPELSPLEGRLEELGVTWCKLSHRQTAEVVRRWAARYGGLSAAGLRNGPRSLAAYAAECGDDFLIGPVPGSGVGPEPAYACRADNLPDLSAFDGLDLFVAPSDLSWTMVFRREDAPSFLRAA